MELVDTWPKIQHIKPGSWAADFGGLEVGCALVSINSTPVSTFEAAKALLAIGKLRCTLSDPFIRLVWQQPDTEEGVPPGGQLSQPVKRWVSDLLAWVPSWITFADGVVSLFDTATPPAQAGAAVLRMDVVERSTSFEEDGWSADRLTLDDSAACVHLMFADGDSRTRFVEALQTTAASTIPAVAAAPAAPSPSSPSGGTALGSFGPQFPAGYDTCRYPFKLGKYLLGPMDPSKQFNSGDPRFRGG